MKKLALVALVTVLSACSSNHVHRTTAFETTPVGSYTKLSHYTIEGTGSDRGYITGEYGFKATRSGRDDKVIELTIKGDNVAPVHVSALFVDASFQIINAKRYYVTTWSTDTLGTAITAEDVNTNEMKIIFSPGKSQIIYNTQLTQVK